MNTIRTRLIALAIACFVVPALAQTKDAPKPATPEKKAEPAKPATTTTTTKETKETKKTETTTVTTAGTAKVGAPAPDFKLKDLDGKERSLAEFKGKVVVLEWSNPGCPFCVRHAKAKTAEKTLAAFKDKPVVWINVDSTGDQKVDEIKKFTKDNSLTTPYLLDPSGATGKAYGAKSTPHVFVIDQKGNLAYTGAIDDDKTGEKGDKAKNYVKDAVDALLKGSAVATSTTDSYGCPVHYKG